ncbi:MAG: UDP-3-O-[3-hydroxymyristoyl] N-acetylglucosamine deacetylase [Phycisphaeraceae bacterium]|nr:UDP-3-O-[3-hydroxymyristoyl] N-acetylglucosamine deacetylase [Phycisphaeraceae bacterium]
MEKTSPQQYDERATGSLMQHKQQTIAKPASVSGRGLFTGQQVNVTFKPAPPDYGIVFSRKDMGGEEIPARIDQVVQQDRRTMLQQGKTTVMTTEHVLSALSGLAIDNCIIELDAMELPGGDGSAKLFTDVILEAGLNVSEAPRRTLVIDTPISVSDGDAVVAAVPHDKPTLQVVYELDYDEHNAIGHQLRVFDSAQGDYAQQLAPARTFVLEAEVRQLRAAGLGKHLTPSDILVINHEGPMGGNNYRFDDEPVRHKILDLIGDLCLLGVPIQGRIVAYKSGHALNHELCRALLKQYREQRRQQLTQSHKVLDIRQLSRILPHRYPMLLVDRVLEIEGTTRAVGIKNVTINEPFFQGHYPGTPIMPGVLIVEAMAQLAGLLVGQELEHTGRLAVLMSMDRVRLRRPVTPGDQLILEAKTIRIRRQLAHMACTAYVGDNIAAEAEIKFMLIDDEQA